MNRPPLDLALQHISETRHLLQTLLTSSEQFDYQKAKLALQALHKKARELAKVQAELNAASMTVPPNVIMLPAPMGPRPTVRL